MLISDALKVGNDVIQLRGSMQGTVYPCSRSLKGMADTGLAQELIKLSSEATERL